MQSSQVNRLHTIRISPLMPFWLRPYRRFPVTNHAGPFHGQGRVCLIWLVAISLLTGGCAVTQNLGYLTFNHQQMLHDYARFAELGKYMEEKVPHLSAATTNDLYYLCEAYAHLKTYNKVLPCLDQMDSNIKNGDRNVWVSHGLSYDNSAHPSVLRAQAYLELGQYKNATANAAKASTIADHYGLGNYPGRIDKIRALGLLVLASALSGEREQAEKFVGHLENLEISMVGLGYVRPAYVSELSKCYMALGDFHRALATVSATNLVVDHVTNVAKILSGSYGDESVFAYLELPKKFILYKSNYETGHMKEAKKGYDDLLAHPGTPSNGDIFWMILFDRGRIAESEGNLHEAIEFYKRAIEVIEQQRSTINTEASKIGYVGNKQKVYHQVIAALVLMGQPTQALEYVERSKARALVDLLASRKEFAAPIGNQGQVDRLLEELEKAEAEGRVQGSVQDAIKNSHRSSRGVQIKENLEATVPDLASLVSVVTVAAMDIQSHLRSEETLVEYYYEEDDLYAFVVTSGAVTSLKLNGANLVTDIKQFRDSIRRVESRQYLLLAESLFSRLIKPLESFLKTPNLLIVSHGALHYLPFAALRKSGGYLVERYNLQHLPSGSVLTYLTPKQGPKIKRLLAFGNPDLGDPKYDLKFAEDEVIAIAKRWPQTKILLRKEATRTAFRSLGTRYPYVHFATHGKFDADAPLNSGLLLAPTSDNDGFLTAGDLYSLRLEADLVTLSACDSGLGHINHGDDVVGMVRGFLYAGAKTIVASLWPVDDEATAIMMAEFYTNLQETTKADALRQAQLATKELYNHPFYWAAFQLTGLAD